MKRIISLILTVLMISSMAACLFACGDGTTDGGNNPPADTKTTYTVTVVDQHGNAIKGAKIEFFNKGTAVYGGKTDENGKIVFKSDKTLTAKVNEIPGGYIYDKLGQSQDFDKDGNLTATVTKPAPMVVIVVDQNGDAVVGVSVQACNDASLCLKAKKTDAEGKVYYDYIEGNFHAQLSGSIEELPAGYTTDDFAKQYDFVDGVATITLNKTAE